MRQIMLVSVLLLGVSWAAAQNPTRPSQKGSSETAGSQTTVMGCLSGSGGNYTLTDKEGNSFQLTGDTAKLAEHVGHEVKITGTASSASGSPSSTGGEMEHSGSSHTLEVSSVKHVSKTCSSGGMAH